MLDTARKIQQVTTMILNNKSDVNATVRQMFADSLIQQATRLTEHHDGGSMKARRRKSCEKRGRKSSRKKLNRKPLSDIISDEEFQLGSHEENGIAERANKEVLRHLRTIVYDKRLGINISR